MNIQALLDQLEELWMRRSALKSLIGFLIILNIGCASVGSLLHFLLSNIKFLSKPEDYFTFYSYFAVVITLLNVLLLFVWAYWRSVPRLGDPEIGILFAPNSDRDCEELVFSLYEKFNQDLSRRGFSKRITHKLLSRDMAVNNADDANRMIEKSGARLLIYGNVRKGNIEGEHTEGFESISFTVRHRSLAEAEVKPVLTDMANALVYRAFVSKDKNSFIDKRTLVENIGEVASFFIAMALTLDGELNEAESMLEKLLSTLERKLLDSRNVIQLNLFKNSVVSCLTVTLEARCSQIYHEHVIENVTQRHVDKYARECMGLQEKILSLNQRTSKYYLLDAVLHFHFGDVGKAKYCVKKALSLSPVNFAAPYFSAAFLDLWQERYDRALTYYLKAEKCTDYTTDVILSVIFFLQSIARSHPEKVQIRFGLAYMNDRFYDPTKAIDDYESFLRATSDINKYKRLRDHAMKRLEALKQPRPE